MPAAKPSSDDESSEDEDEDEVPATKSSAKTDKKVPIILDLVVCDCLRDRYRSRRQNPTIRQRKNPMNLPRKRSPRLLR